MKRWRAVKEYVLVSNYIFKNCPYFWHSIFNQTTSPTDVVCEFLFQEFSHHKWTEEFKCHVLWKTTLVECKLRTNNDH